MHLPWLARSSSISRREGPRLECVEPGRKERQDTTHRIHDGVVVIVDSDEGVVYWLNPEGESARARGHQGMPQVG